MKKYLFLILKTLNPKYYDEIARKDLKSGIKYFLSIIFFAFILMGIIYLPMVYFLNEDIKKASLDIADLNFGAKFNTVKRIDLPSYDPFISFDTNDNNSLEKSSFFISNTELKFMYFGEEKIIPLEGVDITADRKDSNKTFFKLLLFILPSLFFYMYLIYTVKYLLIVVPFSVFSFLIMKAFKKKVEILQSITLSLYTSTAMVFLEILSLPFFVKDYLFSYNIIPGVYFSLVAITLYLIFFVTAIRLVGRKE